MRRGAWVAQLVKHRTLGFSSSHDLTVSWVQAPHQALCWQHRACLGFSPSPLSLPLPCCLAVSLFLFLSQNKYINLKKKIRGNKITNSNIKKYCSVLKNKYNKLNKIAYFNLVFKSELIKKLMHIIFCPTNWIFSYDNVNNCIIDITFQI